MQFCLAPELWLRGWLAEAANSAECGSGIEKYNCNGSDGKQDLVQPRLAGSPEGTGYPLYSVFANADRGWEDIYYGHRL